MEYQPLLVVRPASASVTVEQGPDLVPVRDFPGVFSVSKKSTRLSLQEPKWPDVVFDVTEPRGMTTVRAAPPRATLSLSLAKNAKQKLTVRELPSKTRLTVIQNQVRLPPGPHELLVESAGYLPKRLSVDLAPNERRELTLALVALPTFANPGTYNGSGGLPTSPRLVPRYQRSAVLPTSLPPSRT